MFSDNLFILDTENELVYLGVADQFLALDLTTGKVKIKNPYKTSKLAYISGIMITYQRTMQSMECALTVVDETGVG